MALKINHDDGVRGYPNQKSQLRLRLSVTQVLESKEDSIYTVLFVPTTVTKSTFNCMYLWNLDNWLLRRSWPFNENFPATTTSKSRNWRSCFNEMFDFNLFTLIQEHNSNLFYNCNSLGTTFKAKEKWYFKLLILSVKVVVFTLETLKHTTVTLNL